MNLRDKLLVMVIASAAAAPLNAGPSFVAEPAALHPSIAHVLYGPGSLEFRALARSAGAPAATTGVTADPVCYGERLPGPNGPVEAARAGAAQPVGAVGRVFAGPVAGAHAAGMAQDVFPGNDALSAVPPTPAPAGWKLFLCGLGILAFIAVRRARELGG